MKRTRRWLFVAQEAQRLASLGLSPTEIARRLETVSRSTISRWLKAGKLIRGSSAQVGTAPPGKHGPQVTNDWVIQVRTAYALDATDEMLVQLAESALTIALDVSVAPQVRLQAAGRFQSIARQLNFSARNVPAEPMPAPDTKAPARPPTVRSRVDPRHQLMVVPKTPA